MWSSWELGLVVTYQQVSGGWVGWEGYVRGGGGELHRRVTGGGGLGSSWRGWEVVGGEGLSGGAAQGVGCCAGNSYNLQG